jgi:hypothetical protein
MVTQVKTKTLDKLALDGGNAFLKWSYGSTIQIESSWAVKLDHKQEVPSSALQTQYFSERWVFGDTAKDLGGQPLFALGKEVMTPILLKAILESTGHEAINKLSVLVPDSRNEKWDMDVKSQIIASVPVTDVKFISEGIPPFNWAKEAGVWKWPNMQNAVLDCGGGDLSLRMFTRSGIIDWSKSFTLPGTKAYAEKISRVISSDCTYTPSPGDILSAIEDGTYEYIDNGRVVDFSANAERIRCEWISHIRNIIRSKWQSEGTKVGQVMLVGGGVRLLKDGLLGDNRPYFVPFNKQVGDDFPQMINAFAMAQL